MVKSKKFPNKEKIENFKNQIILNASESFQKELEYLIKQELQKNLAEIKKRNLEVLEKLFKELDFSMREISQSTIEIKNQITKEAQKNISTLNIEFNKEIASISAAKQTAEKVIIEEAKKRLMELSGNISGEISKTYKSAEETLSQMIKNAQKEIENYKWEKMQEIDKKIYKVLIEISKNIIGKTIDFSTHEDLIIQALNQAKKNGLFEP